MSASLAATLRQARADVDAQLAPAAALGAVSVCDKHDLALFAQIQVMVTDLSLLNNLSLQSSLKGIQKTTAYQNKLDFKPQLLCAANLVGLRNQVMVSVPSLQRARQVLLRGIGHLSELRAVSGFADVHQGEERRAS